MKGLQQMSFRKFVSKDLEQQLIEQLRQTQTDNRLSPGLRQYLYLLSEQIRPKGADECAKYAANVLEKIKEDYVEGYWKQTLSRFIGKVSPEQREVLKALNELLEKL